MMVLSYLVVSKVDFLSLVSSITSAMALMDLTSVELDTASAVFYKAFSRLDIFLGVY